MPDVVAGEGVVPDAVSETKALWATRWRKRQFIEAHKQVEYSYAMLVNNDALRLAIQ